MARTLKRAFRDDPKELPRIVAPGGVPGQCMDLGGTMREEAANGVSAYDGGTS